MIFTLLHYNHFQDLYETRLRKWHANVLKSDNSGFGVDLVTMHPPRDVKNALLWRSILKGFVLGLLCLTVFAAGFVVRGILPVAPALALADPGGSQFPLLSEVEGLLDEYFIRDLPNGVELEYAAIRGMMGALDDSYTFFNPPVVTQNESDALAGQFGGIGVDVQYAADGQFRLYPYPNSPAIATGIEDGDVLLAIDDAPVVAEIGLDVIRQKLKGEVGNGNGVTVRIQGFSTGAERELRIEFAVVNVPSVIWRTLLEDSRIGYIHIKLFTGRTPDELRVALSALQSSGIQALVLDLRDNPGGLLQESIDTADEFLDEGVIFFETGRDNEREQAAQPGGATLTLPMTVIVNQRTASAAELVAGALRDNDRAAVLGQTTTGKGSVQLIFPLSDGSSVHITSSEWLTPNRAPINGMGLTPDIPMIPAENGRDVELDEAVRRLQQDIAELE